MTQENWLITLLCSAAWSKILNLLHHFISPVLVKILLMLFSWFLHFILKRVSSSNATVLVLVLFCPTIIKPGRCEFHHWRSLYRLISQTLILQINAIFLSLPTQYKNHMATVFKISTDLSFGPCWTKWNTDVSNGHCPSLASVLPTGINAFDFKKF